MTEQPYILEVSSPGIDRILKRDKEYVKYKDRDVDVKLFRPFEGKKEFHGRLVGLFDGKVVITDESGTELAFDKKDVASTRLSVDI